MNRTFLAFILYGIVSNGAPVTFAQQTGGPGQEPNGGPRPVRIPLVQSALDKNKDGSLSAEEIAGASVSLASLDRNKDGKLTGEELRPVAPPVGPTIAEMVARLMEFDGNGNGTLSKDELPEQLSSTFTQADANRDNVLTNAELTALVEKQDAEAKARAASKPAPPAPAGGRLGGPPRGGGRPMRVPPLQAALDTDSNGEIAPAELAGAANSLLVLDKNKDGVLDADELRPAPVEEKPETPPAPPHGV